MGKRILRYFLRFLLLLLVTLLVLAGALYGVIYKCCNGPSEAAKATFITTILETGQLKFLASWVCSADEIQAVVDQNKMKPMETESDRSLIKINRGQGPDIEDPVTPEGRKIVYDENGVYIEEVAGRTFFGKMMVIKDPAQVIVGTTYPWGEYGKDLDKIVKECGGVGGVNGGLYQSDQNKGGKPYGVVVSKGQIQYNSPSQRGLYLIGLDESDILVVKDIQGMKAADVEKYVKEAKIRDAVTFQEEASDVNNHFVPLVIDGKGRELSGQGSGSNPRTAIGQRADGAILLFVTDGRGAGGHLGATASDLISVMLDFGAVTAANLDGGSSSTMYYKDQYEMTSVTFYYQNSSWRLPDAMVVMPPAK
ncbi:MAG: phosphodiester glycosidase family protein [Lachnospiraceae bacterium]|nr:phosphodiester glycosidase family protein [Lachnospiraceae bacterium]